MEELQLGAENSLATQCTELLGGEAAFLEGATVARELLMGDWLYHHYTR